MLALARRILTKILRRKRKLVSFFLSLNSLWKRALELLLVLKYSATGTRKRSSRHPSIQRHLRFVKHWRRDLNKLSCSLAWIPMSSLLFWMLCKALRKSLVKLLSLKEKRVIVSTLWRAVFWYAPRFS